MSLGLIKKRIHRDILKGVDFIDLSGNYGDPIYHKNFLKTLKYFKENHSKIYIETNGSGKDKKFWKEAVSILDDRDVITFSVDGLKDTNSIYRINSKWDDIQQAMEVVSQSQVQAHWKFIVFKHNQKQIEEAQEFSNRLGISHFIIVKSSLFGKAFYNKNGEGVDPLMPEKKWTKSFFNSQRKELNFKINPKCLNLGLHYISAEAYYFPCCWIGHYHIAKTLFSENEMQSLSLHHFALEDILQSKALKKLEKLWQKPSKAPPECINKCQWTNSPRDKTRSFHEKAIIKMG